MKKIGFICIGIILIIIGFIGKFYYVVFTSDYSHTFPITTSDSVKEIDSLRVGTYNIKSMNYVDSTTLFQEELASLDLDVIALQEVDKDALRSGNIDMVEQLALACGYEYSYFYPSMWILDGYYGLGILSKYPIVEVESMRLPNSLLKEPRILTKTIIELGNTYISIYNTHLTYGQTEERYEQLRFVENEMLNAENTILLGDFNTFGWNGSLHIDGMQAINNEGQYVTFRQIASPDNIFYSSQFTLLDSGMSETTFSDHNLIYATFQYK